jgi:hypothetical protein
VIKTHVFFRCYFQVATALVEGHGRDDEDPREQWRWLVALADTYVKSVFVIHVGGTRWVTSRTDNNMKIHARITLTVECIRPCIFLFDVEIQ